MRDLYDKITALFETKDYAGEVKSNLKTALEVRIGSLLKRGVGAMLNTQRSSPTIADLLKYPTILELDYLNQHQANLMTFLLLTKIREYIKRQRTEKAGNPEHILLLEEAHNLVGINLGTSSGEDANTKQEAANYVTRMLAEMRALREAIIIADQLPTGLAAEVVKNTNVKIAHRLVSADDRKDIGQAMLLDQSQMEEIARLEPGESFLYMEGWQPGVYANADNKMIATVERAVQTRETNVEECQENIGEVKTQMDGKLENIKKLMNTQGQRIEKMENAVDSFKHKNDHIVNDIKFEIQTGKDDLDDAKDKSVSFLKIIEVAGALAAGVGLAAQGISQLLSTLQSIGILK